MGWGGKGENKPGKSTWMSQKPNQGAGFAAGAPAGWAVTAQGEKFPLDQLPSTARAEDLLSRSP